MKAKLQEEILIEFDEAIQYFINRVENLPGTEFCGNVNKLINIKCEIAKLSELDEGHKLIPLTKKLIEKIRDEIPCDDGIIFEKNRWYYLIGCEFPVQIEYVHQIQNLYWCLYNEELTIKP